jgi:hypothetical protein
VKVPRTEAIAVAAPQQRKGTPAGICERRRKVRDAVRVLPEFKVLNFVERYDMNSVTSMIRLSEQLSVRGSSSLCLQSDR